VETGTLRTEGGLGVARDAFRPEVCNVRRLKSGMVKFVPFAHKNSPTEGHILRSPG
jgi:hypothetical protein